MARRSPDFAAQRAHMVRRHLAARDVQDARVLAAMGEVPRERFVPPESAAAAYDDCALPIGMHQTISQPYVVALMLQALELTPTARMLEIGAGSGYAVAVASRIAAEVIGVERLGSLVTQARSVLEALGAENVSIEVGDGSLGWPAGAPYDAILVSAGGPVVPDALIAQLTIGGRLVMPVGRSSGGQRLVRVRRTAAGTEQDDLGAVAFVPLIGAQGWPR